MEPEHRCEDYVTEPGVFYHAHDLKRCTEPGTAWMDGRLLCDTHRRQRGALTCLAHLRPEPCPTCSAYIAAGL